MMSRTTRGIGYTAHRLSKNVTFYNSELASSVSGSPTKASEEHKPLMLMLPWLGSRPQAVAKYCEIYFRTGMDVLVVESESLKDNYRFLQPGPNFVRTAPNDTKLIWAKEFLWPRWGLDHGKRVLELLQSERFVSRPLLVHAFSIGGFTFTQMLVHVCQDAQKYQALTGRIKGQIYDSLVVGSLETMAIGLGKTVFPHWETLVKEASMFYFSMFKRQTVDYFNTSIDAFWNTPVTAPALFFFCENDAMSDARVMEELIAHLRKRGIDVTAKKWEDSTHAGHLKRHPQEYLTTLDRFLHSHGIVPLKANM